MKLIESLTCLDDLSQEIVLALTSPQTNQVAVDHDSIEIVTEGENIQYGVLIIFERKLHHVMRYETTVNEH